MKKVLMVLLALITLALTGCVKENETKIYIGEDGYWYINDIKTGTYSIGQDGKSAYEVAKENGYTGTFESWLSNITKDSSKLEIIDTVGKNDVTGYIQMVNNQIMLVAEYDEVVEIKEGVLEEIGHENKTLYDIFVLNNYAPDNMDSKRSRNENYEDSFGITTIQDEVYYTYNKAMYVEGTTSNQAKSSASYTGDYYIASKLKCTRYEKGYLGIVFGSDAEAYKNTTLTGVTDDFVTRSDICTLDDHNIFIGSCISANLDGYIDDTVVVDLSIFDSVPSKEKLDSLYERYLDIMNGKIEVNTYTEVVSRRKVFYLGETEISYSDSDAKARFMKYMNDKAKDIGMENTTFIDAAGFYNRTTAYDLLRMGVYACSYDPLVEAWHKNTYTVNVSGNMERDVNLSTTVKGEALEDYYFLFGGKTGTVDGQSNLLAVVEGPDNRLFVVVVLGASVNRFEAAKQVMDLAVKKYNDPSFDYSTEDVPAKSAAACLLPLHNTKAYTDYPLTMLYEKDIYTSRTPASITKVMTAMCMLDFVYDLNEDFVISQKDITSGSGNYYYAGDMISYKESLYSMMLPSSNTCAEATATAVGHLILKYENKNKK